MESHLAGKVAVVTGAGRGIGRAEAIGLAMAGASVVVNDLGAETTGLGQSNMPADEVVAEIAKLGGKAVTNYESVADFQAAGRIVQHAIDVFGRLDILVNNAGILGPDGVEEHTEDAFDQVLAVHLKGTFNTCVHAIPFMKKQGYGRIINTASYAWNLPTGRVAYAAAKGGIVSLTWALAWELDGFGITANVVAPFAGTRMTQGIPDRDRKLFEAGLMTEQRFRQTAVRPDPAFVAPMIVFLASDFAAQVNGCVFRAGGGKIARFSHPEEALAVFRDYERDGPWTIEQLKEVLPRTLFTKGAKAPHL